MIGKATRCAWASSAASTRTPTGNNQLFIGGTGGADLTAGPKANAGKLTAGGAPNTPGEIVLTLNDTANNNGGITIVSDIVDNGTGAVTLIKTSVMSVKIDGHNSYSGGTYINQGRFQLAGSEQLRDSVDTTLTIGNPDGLGTGPVFIAPGAYLFISGVNGTGQYTGPGAIAGAYFSGATPPPPPPPRRTRRSTTTCSSPATALARKAAAPSASATARSSSATSRSVGDARIVGGNGALYPRIDLNAGHLDGATLYVDPGNEISGQITGDFDFDFGGRAVSVGTKW